MKVLNKRLGVAKVLRTRNALAAKHNFDYRGQKYHVPDFGHHNSDYTTGALFLFADCKPIGEHEDVLKIQLANRYGIDVRIRKPELPVDENAEKIYRSGADFRASYPFWSNASEPLVPLAACREYGQ